MVGEEDKTCKEIRGRGERQRRQQERLQLQLMEEEQQLPGFEDDNGQFRNKQEEVQQTPGQFMKRFRLPENARTDQVKASMENGVLTVTVPKEEAKKPDVKSVETHLGKVPGCGWEHLTT
ncbi:17.8 kDa class I heat shock protein-like [Cornus florida]|uniref:17.8 kDa class I heat shock protein-like n=1 Tax=Cornus florida TaxID=4283 RepID=UPI00289FE119|nr:17.8 kDa class I heat shock protein-like [Cornus florida]